MIIKISEIQWNIDKHDIRKIMHDMNEKFIEEISSYSRAKMLVHSSWEAEKRNNQRGRNKMLDTDPKATSP